jgi:serine/threonine protein kinase
MSETFDPYHEWLGIPASLQPANHYRLLGIAAFEENSTVIANAADQRMMILRTFQTGKHATESQKLLNEVAAAKVCLLNAEKKAAYDAQLREKLQDRRIQPPLPPPPPPAGPRDQAAAGPGLEETVAFDPKLHAAVVSEGQAPRASQLPKLGEYQLLERLGEGGMGVVYRALHTKLGREVAIKLLSKARLQDAEAVARFEREMRAIGALEHPNVVHAHDAREIDGTRCLVMELLDGLDLDQVLHRCGPLPVADACEVVRQAALGLQCAHEHHLVHRDIKPSNLMLTRAGQVKILDLGLARAELGHAGGQELTATGQALGTLDYMAPEQIAEKAVVDVRADIYSLGCTLFKLLTGIAPFSGWRCETAFEKMNAHLKKAPPAIRQSRREVPPELAAMIYRMMAKSPDARFANPGQLADAIGPMAAGSDLAALISRAQGTPAVLPSQAQAATEPSVPSSLTRMIQQFSVKRRQRDPRPAAKTKPWLERALTLAAAVLVPLLALGIWWVWPKDNGPREQAAASGAALVFDCPQSERQQLAIYLDDRRLQLPASGPLVEECQPGMYNIRVERAGFKPYVTMVVVDPQQRRKIAPVWEPLAKRAGPKPGPSKLDHRDVALNVAEPAKTAPVKTEPAKPEPAKTEPAKPGPKPPPAISEEDRKRLAEFEAAEARYAEALKPAEALVAAWDFRGALAAIAKVHFTDKDDAARLAARAGEVKRLAALKERMIAKINAADPPLKKKDLMLRGVNGEVLNADEEGITAKPAGGKTELHAWGELGEKARTKICQLSVDRGSADDWIASGLLALAHQDAALAERCFDKAASLGTSIAPYLDPLGAAGFARAMGLTEKESFAEAQAALKDVEEKCGKTSWFASHEKSVAALRRKIASGLQGVEEANAERIYKAAVKLFAARERFDLKRLLEQLKTNHPNTPAVTDTARKPSFAEMEAATANLGKFIVVRQDGKGDFTKIQAAINAAPPRSVIEMGATGLPHHKC